MIAKKNRISIIGTGFVGTTYAYALINQAITEELVLIDMNGQKAEGEAMDLNHAIPFAPSPTKVWHGDYSDCKEASIICITAGVSQNEEETRLTVVEKNAKIVRNIVEKVMESGFDGIFLIASNPVDIMTHVAWKASGLPKERVIGTGTLLDTSRYLYMLSKYFNVDSRNINGYIIGEHGDSQVAVLSNLTIAGKSVYEIVKANPAYTLKDLEDIAVNVRDAAYHIYDRKGPTCYGIGMVLARLTKAVFKDENVILPVSAHLDGEFGSKDIYIGVPAVINGKGVQEVYEVPLNKEEKEKFDFSIEILKRTLESISQEITTAPKEKV